MVAHVPEATKILSVDSGEVVVEKSCVVAEDVDETADFLGDQHGSRALIILPDRLLAELARGLHHWLHFAFLGHRCAEGLDLECVDFDLRVHIAIPDLEHLVTDVKHAFLFVEAG